MTNKNLITGIIFVIALAVAGSFYMFNYSNKDTPKKDIDPTPQNVTLTGTYTCLPHLDTKGPQTMECAFGLQAENGDYYAVNFGASGDSMNQFRAGETITAEGFVVIKEALSADQWQKYNMKGIFTITKMISPTPGTAVQGKINIDQVCNEALMYMTFTDSKASDKFVAECKEGKHPQVIEDYKIRMGLGDGAQI
jgi:hypothetical protein